MVIYFTGQSQRLGEVGRCYVQSHDSITTTLAQLTGGEGGIADYLMILPVEWVSWCGDEMGKGRAVVKPSRRRYAHA